MAAPGPSRCAFHLSRRCTSNLSAINLPVILLVATEHFFDPLRIYGQEERRRLPQNAKNDSSSRSVVPAVRNGDGNCCNSDGGDSPGALPSRKGRRLQRRRKRQRESPAFHRGENFT